MAQLGYRCYIQATTVAQITGGRTERPITSTLAHVGVGLFQGSTLVYCVPRAMSLLHPQLRRTGGWQGEAASGAGLERDVTN